MGNRFVLNFEFRKLVIVWDFYFGAWRFIGFSMVNNMTSFHQFWIE